MFGRDGSHLLKIDRLWTQPLLQSGHTGIYEVLVETSGCAENQEPGERLSDVLETVGDVAGQEDECAGASFKQLVAAFEEERSVQDIEHLVIAAVDVPRGSEVRWRQHLDQAESTAGRFAGRLECHAGGRIPDRLALIGLQDVGV